MPNATLWHMRSLTPHFVDDVQIEVQAIDEMLEYDLSYLNFDEKTRTLVALVGTQTHQFHRAADIAALAVERGAQAIIGGPHPMTCDTSELQRKGISFSLAEAELVWLQILKDAIKKELAPVYGREQRWQQELNPPVVDPPPPGHLKRYIMPMLGIYPARGCPFRCDFCSVIKVAGNKVRTQPIDTTLESIRRAKAAGVKTIVFTSDNFNKYSEAPQLLDAMVRENLQVSFFAQCDTQIVRQEGLIEKMSRAGCKFFMVGAESFDRETLLKAKKTQNHPDQYAEIVRLCRKYGIAPYFSNIIGFPGDTREKVKEHVRQLKLIGPSASWFYIMTPGPGTEQYDNFMSEGLITEKNLDRFDATYPTWRHPHFSHKVWIDLLYECYAEFYSAPATLYRLYQAWRAGVSPAVSLHSLGYSALCRLKARQRVHPMIGGIRRFCRDHADEYILRRKKTFGHELFPLPQSLSVPQADIVFQNIPDKK